MVFAILASGVLLYTLFALSRIYSKYQLTKNSGFTLRFHPLEVNSPASNIFMTLCQPLVNLAKVVLPHHLFRTYDLSVYGVEWRDRVARRERELPGYFVLTPARTLELFVEDAELAQAILARRKQFEQDAVTMKFMNQFGPSLSGSRDEAWARQRRLVAPMLNERIMETVWGESVEQAGTMLKHFEEVEGGTTNGTVKGLRNIAFNILSRIAYGIPSEWSAETMAKGKDGRMEFSQALYHLLDGLIVLAVFPAWLLKLPFMPNELREIGQAHEEFYQHSGAMLQKEQELLRASSTPRNSFLASLATVKDSESDPYEKEGRLNKPAFTEEQITGNLYTFTVAGFDTTANTMAYAVAMLVAYPKWQDWIFEEIDRIRKEVENPWSYQEVLPKLERCMAIMLESLRIFTPVCHICRESGEEDSVVTAGGKTYHIPANTRLTLSLDGFGAKQSIWGDAFEFRPTRWSAPPAAASTTATAQVPKLEPVGGDKAWFLPWSAGPRLCPGMKMAQVEFLSVIYTIFSSYRAEPVLEAGETKEMGKQRVLKVIEDSMPKLTLQMNRPEDLKVRWVKR